MRERESDADEGRKASRRPPPPPPLRALPHVRAIANARALNSLRFPLSLPPSLLYVVSPLEAPHFVHVRA